MMTYLKCSLTLALSTLMVLSAFSQYYTRTYFNELIWSRTFNLIPFSKSKMLTYSGIVHLGSNTETNVIGNINNTGEYELLQEIDKDKALFILGKSLKSRNDTIFYSCTDRKITDQKMNWYLGILVPDENINKLYSYSFDVFGNGFPNKYGMELVKNNEIIIWGAGLDPALQSNENDPRVIWIRVKKDGTLVSGPHYYKPSWLGDWAQATDADVDLDGNMVFVYDYPAWGFPEKYIFKILENDSIMEIARFPLYKREANPRAKIKVAIDGHYIVTNFDTSKRNIPPLLTKLDRQGKKVWESSFDLIYGYWYGYFLPNVGNFTLNKITETKNGDILICGFNTQIDSLYIPFLNKKILTSGWTGAYMARFDPDGKVKWIHFLASLKDNGTFRKININDIQETDDGSIVLGGSLGVRDTTSNIFHSWVMKVGPNGCFDEACSHVDKWWFFPEEIVTATEAKTLLGEITIYPNPGHDMINLTLPDDVILPVKYRITDMQGRTHESGVYHQQVIKLDAGFLPPGLYLITIMDKAGKIWQGKWVKY